MLRGPPSMGSKQRVRGRRSPSCETEESEAAGAEGRRSGGGTKGHARVGKGIEMGCFATPLAHLVPGGLLDGQQQHLRQKLVD
eukprot:6533887-Prymnesium_polylepis.1